MDNVTLSTEQLHKLIAFIESRGFHKPLVIVEILDHFACKVEEKMKANPNISIEEAMAEAHYDFGTLGFYPVVSAYEANVKQKYKLLYRAERKKVFANPLYMLTAVIAAALFYKGYNWAEANNFKHLFDCNDVAVLLYVLFITCLGLIVLKFKRKREEDLINTVILYRDWWAGLLIISFSLQSHPHYNPKQLLFLSVMGTLGTFGFVYSSFAKYAAMKKGYDDSAIVYDYFKSVN